MTPASATDQPNPRDVAVAIDPVERHKHALSLAYRHGFTDDPDAFARRLSGTTAGELEADAQEFAGILAELRERNASKNAPAVDPSQGMYMPNPPKNPATELAEKMRDQLGER